MINNDTIVGFTPKQSRKLDQHRVDAEKTKKENKIFKDRLNECNVVNEGLKAYVTKLENERKTGQELQILTDSKVATLTTDLAKSQKSNERKTGTIKILGGGFIAVSLTLIGVLVFN